MTTSLPTSFLMILCHLSPSCPQPAGSHWSTLCHYRLVCISQNLTVKEEYFVSPVLSILHYSCLTSDTRCVAFLHIKQFGNTSWVSCTHQAIWQHQLSVLQFHWVLTFIYLEIVSDPSDRAFISQNCPLPYSTSIERFPWHPTVVWLVCVAHRTQETSLLTRLPVYYKRC